MNRSSMPPKATIIGLAERLKVALRHMKIGRTAAVTNERTWASFHLDYGVARYRISVEYVSPSQQP